jgi:RNA polymerase sigma factor (sigma-70 family)
MMGLVRDRARWSDAQLLAAIARCDDRAFSAFYRRHLSLVVGWCAEPTHESAAGWLLGIARNVLGHSVRRGQVDGRARRRLGASPLTVEDDDLARVLELADDQASSVRALLAGLPVDERLAVRARVIEERDYGEIAQSLGCSEMVIRKRVSRGLARLRARMAS